MRLSSPILALHPPLCFSAVDLVSDSQETLPPKEHYFMKFRLSLCLLLLALFATVACSKQEAPMGVSPVARAQRAS
jgi:hypothetical protein